MFYNSVTEEVTFIATLPELSYLGIGFGTSMKNTEYIIWLANGINSQQLRSHSDDSGAPTPLEDNFYQTDFEVNDNTKTV